MHKRKPKIRKLEPTPKKKVGRVFSNNVHFEAHEYETIILLTQFGFDIEPAKQNNTPETHNADISMLGTTWEMKSPEKFREKPSRNASMKLRAKPTTLFSICAGLNPTTEPRQKIFLSKCLSITIQFGE